MTVEKLNLEFVQLKTKQEKLKKITGGIVKIDESEYQIYQASKPRNPDGTVHHTTLELM